MNRALYAILPAVLLLLSGCGSVAYQVRPDAPPAMSYQEALDAMEMALSMMNRRGIDDARHDEDGITIFRRSLFASNIGALTSRIRYADVESDVLKMENEFVVFVGLRTSVHSYERTSFSWKSVDEARQFVDAARILARGPGLSARLSAPAAPRERPVPRQKPAHAAAVASPPETKPVTVPAPAEQATAVAARPQAPAAPIAAGPAASAPGKEKAAAPVLPPAEPPAPPLPRTVAARPKPLSRKEAPPPAITITSPDAARAVRIASRQSSILVTGVADSAVGVSEVKVNDEPAELDEKGRFSREVFLRVGQNRIAVTATDIRGRSSTRTVTLHRESGKVLEARREAPAPPPVQGIGVSTYHALLIAVQDYASSDITRLDNPVADAHRLREVLTADYTFEPANVTVLENPDRRTIYRTLQATRKRLTERDSLLIFFAGHGMWMEDMRQGFWLPRDASGINDPSDWIPNSTVRDYIKSFQAKHVLLVADACFGGGIFKVRDAFPKSPLSIERIFAMNSRKAITSGSLKSVPDRSVFVEYLVKRLHDNRDRYLDSQKLFASLREAVINNSPTGQTPLYGAISEAGDEGGDFVFVRRTAE